MVPGSLSAAAYWAGLRQEIYSAIISQSRVKINLDHFIVDRSFQPADDYTWSNRAVVNLADVLNYCFDAPPSPTKWTALDEHCRRWEELRPSSFEPFFYQEREVPDAFPEIWHHSSCHSKTSLIFFSRHPGMYMLIIGFSYGNPVSPTCPALPSPI